ncbi:MAG: ECF transporter S component [Vagococcus sp.]
MIQKYNNVRILTLCALAICLNVAVGSLMTHLQMPFLYLDAIGTIFIAFNFSMKYAILTGLSTNLLLAVLFGPLAIPFSLVSMTVALVANLCAKKEVTYKRAIIIGILLAAIGALVSAPIRVVLFGGFEGLQRKPSDLLVITLKASGRKLLIASYWGAFTDSFFDKIFSCLLVVWLGKRPELKRYFALNKNSL